MKTNQHIDFIERLQTMPSIHGVKSKAGFISILLLIVILIPSAGWSEFSETFTETNTFSDKFIQAGASSYSVSLDVPPGRQGMAPNLEIIYSSLRPNGWLGVGWVLDMGSIQRNTRLGLDYSGDNYVFTKNARNTELVDRSTDWGNNVFGAKIESKFTQYQLVAGGSGDYWVAATRDGDKYYFGQTLASRVENGDGDIFKWCLDRVEDPNGNYMTISYTKDQNQIYLDEIAYAGHTSISPTNVVRFYLENTRPDIGPMYQSHMEVVTDKRLKTVEMQTNGSIVGAYAFTYSETTHAARSRLATIQKYGNDSTIGVSGEISGGTSFPPISMTYSDSVVGSVQESWGEHGGYYLPAGGYGGGYADWNGDGKTDIIHNKYGGIYLIETDNGEINFNQVYQEYNGTRNMNVVTDPYLGGFGDFNGDGKADYVYNRKNDNLSISNNMAVVLSTGSGGSSSIWGVKSAEIEPGDFGIGDFTGDGLDDLMYRQVQGDGDKIYVLVSDGSSFTEELWSNTALSNSRGAQGVGDYNGDGLSDWCFITGDGVFMVMLSTGSALTFQSNWASRGNSSLLAYQEYGFGDFNGDGLTDYCYGTLSRSLVYDPYTGSPTFITQPTETYYIALSTGDGFDIQQWGQYEHDGDEDYNYISFAGLGDFNGDGRTDLTFSDTGGNVKVMFSNGDSFQQTSWGGASKLQTACGEIINAYTNDRYSESNSIRVVTDYTPLFQTSTEWPAPTTTVGLGDFDGDGKTDFIYSYEKEAVISEFMGITIIISPAIPPTLYTLTTNPGIPDLLTEVDNGLGSTIEYEYTPSHEWDNDYLPFLLQTLSSVTVDDGLGNTSTTELSYSGGKYNPMEREFRGFETVTITNPDGTISVTDYEQDDNYLKGRPLTHEFHSATPGTDTLKLSTTYTWASDAINSSDANFVRLSSKETDIFDIIGGVSTTASEKNISYSHNADTGLTEYEIVTGSDYETGTGPSIKTAYEYEQPAGVTEWLWRLEEEAVFDYSTLTLKSQTNYTHDNFGNVIGVTYWLDGGTSPSVSYTYDSYGNQVSFTDAHSHTWTTTYDTTAHAYPVTEQNPLGHTTSKTWDQGFGVPLTATDANNYTTTFSYDVFGRLEQTDAPDGGMTELFYTDTTCPRTIRTRVWDSGTSYIDSMDYFDGLGRSVQHVNRTENSLYAVSRTEYDEMGRVIYQVGPFFNGVNTWVASPPTSSAYYVSTEYDYLGRVTSTTTPNTSSTVAVTEYEYDATKTTVTDPDDGVTETIMDYLGRTREIVENNASSQYSTTYGYDVLGRLTSILDHKGNTITTTYDTLGRKTQMVHPDMGTWQYAYDANGNLTSQTDAKSQVVSFQYDELNRVRLKSYPNSSMGSVNYIYDGCSGLGTHSIGRLTLIQNSESYYLIKDYDPMGRIASDGRCDRSQPMWYDFNYTYDLAGRPTSTEYPDGFEVDYTYIPGTSLWSQVISGTQVLAEFSGYTALGKYEMVDYANGVTTMYDYDADSTRLMNIQTYHGATDYQEYAYSYTDGGNIASITDAMRGHAYTYAYDDLHRLTNEAATSGSMAWTYDSIGNILSKSQDGSSVTYAYTATTHKLASVTAGGTAYNYAYDANGNITSCPKFDGASITATLAIDYNVDNMPAQVVKTVSGQPDVTTNFYYDGDGNRVRKEVVGESTTFYAGSLYEVKNGVATKYIFGADRRVAKITDGEGIQYFSKDHLGSSTVVTDASGNIVEQADYRPFGEDRFYTGTASTPTPYKYTDQELDPSTGLYNYDARHYDPAIGRFISPDSLIPNAFDPQQLNPYAYCRNNPLIYVDPTGHASEGRDPTGGAGDPDSIGSLSNIGDSISSLGDQFSEGWSETKGWFKDGSWYSHNNTYLDGYVLTYSFSFNPVYYEVLTNQMPLCINPVDYSESFLIGMRTLGMGIMVTSMGASAFLVADDVTVIGIVDDPALVVTGTGILLGAYIVAKANGQLSVYNRKEAIANLQAQHGKKNPVQGNVQQKVSEEISRQVLENGKRPDRCDVLNQMIQDGIYTKKEVQPTLKAWGCKHSRQSGDKKQ